MPHGRAKLPEPTLALAKLKKVATSLKQESRVCVCVCVHVCLQAWNSMTGAPIQEHPTPKMCRKW